MKRVLLLFVILVIFFSLLGLGYYFLYLPRQLESQNVDRISVTTSFYPLAEFATAVGGDRISVRNLTPAGSEPHDFEPTPQDIAYLEQSALFIFNGAGFESWVKKVTPDLQKQHIDMVNVSEGINLIGLQDSSKESTLYNPHFWLDPILAMQEVDTIANHLTLASPSDKELFEENATSYKVQLSNLDQEIKDGLATCNKKEIVTSHDAFGYFAKRYGLTIVPISGLSPDEEPSPQKLAEITNFAQEHQISYIFFESLVSPRLAETIAHEVKAKTLVFNPIEGLTDDEIKQGKNYISVQRENLANLRIALDCK